MPLQAGDDFGNPLRRKIGQLTLLAQGHINGIIIEHVLTDDTDHRLHLLRVGNAGQSFPQLFYRFFQFHNGAKLQEKRQMSNLWHDKSGQIHTVLN